MVITGEVGTGKTTLLHTLLQQHDNSIKAAFVFYPRLSFHDFLLYVLNNFGLQTTAMTAAQGLTQLHQFLLEQHHKGEITVLVIDEAQSLPISLLEEIRMLSNLETPGEKLLQIALVGQPELQRKLRSPRLRQLRQRINVTYEIRPLSYIDMRDYIRHRCAVAGRAEPTLFTRSALQAIYTYSNGIPRLINTVCDQALLTGYAEARRRINRRIVRQVARELEAQPRRKVLTPPVRGAAVVLTGLLLLGIALYTVRGLAFVSPVFTQLQASLLHVQDLLKGQAESPASSIAGSNVSLETTQPLMLDTASKHDGLQEKETEAQQRLEDNTIDIILPQSPLETESIPEKDLKTTAQNHIANESSQPQKEVFPRTKTMKEGDYVSKYAMEIYGYSNNTLITWIHKHNQHIKDMARVKVGETIVFPVLDTPLQ
jgi:type II secretory pathway predicted ATPase ExeA